MKEGFEVNGLRPCLIYIDEEGRWHHKGAEIIRRDYIQDFYKNMKMDIEGRYVITWEGKRCYVDVADTAFVVWSVLYRDGMDGRNARFILSISDDSQEELRPETLYVGKDNILYCRIKEAAFPARFNRAAYYLLAAHIEEQDNAFYLPLNGTQYEIKGAS